MYKAALKQTRQKPVVIVEEKVARPKTLQQKRQKMRSHGEGLSGIGATIGNMVAPGIGGLLGHAAEGLFKTILGFGDYTEATSNKPLPVNNTIMGTTSPLIQEQVENMHWNGLATRIAHREYIGSISMSNGFAAAEYNIEPRSQFMFPWLSRLTGSFQKWKLLGLVFEYIPTSTNAVAAGTPAVGQVALCIQYDTQSFVPSSLTNLLNTQGAVSARPQDGFICAVECDPGLTPTNPLFIVEDETSIPDNHWYVFGKLIIATQGPAAYSNCGQLWCTYDMQLISQFVPSPAPRVPVPAPTITDGSSKSNDDFIHATVSDARSVSSDERKSGVPSQTSTGVLGGLFR